MAEHTPLPWRYGGHNDGNFRIYAPNLLGTRSGPVAEVLHRHDGGERTANARLIVRAVNNHERLVAMLQEFRLEAFECDASDWPELHEIAGRAGMLLAEIDP